MTVDKRKADTLGENITGRPHSKRPATYVGEGNSRHDSTLSTNPTTHEGLEIHAGKSWTQHQPITPPSSPLKDYGFTSNIDMEEMDIDTDETPSPSLLALQHSLTRVYERHSHFIGPTHQSELAKARREVMSSSDCGRVLVAGEAFVARLHEYVQDLQQAAVRQIQWRASISATGASREVMAAADVLLSQLDEQIIGIGAEAEGLMQEILVLRNHKQVSATSIL